MLKKYPKPVYATILGLLTGSVFSIIYTTIQDYSEKINFSSPWLYVVSTLMLILGILGAYFMAAYDKHKAQSVKTEEKDDESENC